MLKFSGRVAPHDELHQVVPEAVAPESTDQVIAPTYVNVPNVGQVPQYAGTVAGQLIGYDPAQDCNGYYMSYKFQPNNNCYAYATVVASNSFAQPGRMHSYLYPSPPTGPGVQKGAEMDGLVAVGATVDEVRDHAANAGEGHYVALFISAADEPNGWPGD